MSFGVLGNHFAFPDCMDEETEAKGSQATCLMGAGCPLASLGPRLELGSSVALRCAACCVSGARQGT